MRFSSCFLALTLFSNVFCLDKHVHFDPSQVSDVRKSVSSPSISPQSSMSPQQKQVDSVPKSFSADQLIFSEKLPPLRAFRRGSATPDHLRAWILNSYLLANNLFTLIASGVDTSTTLCNLSTAINQVQVGYTSFANCPNVISHLNSVGYVIQAQSAFETGIQEKNIDFLIEFMKEWTDLLKQDVKHFPTKNRLETLQNCIDIFKNVSSVYQCM